VRPKNKGFKNPSKNRFQPPAINTNQTQNQGAQSKSGFVPFDLNKKYKKLGDFRLNGFRVGWGENWNFGDLGGRRWVGTVENGRRWCSGGGCGGGWWWVWVDLGLGEERDGGAGWGCCTAEGGNEGSGEKLT
jgi:hypothetical protein